ncbi:glycoside hydrolase family 127 protein [Streptosporangiaceae bacterium NEAU-GS5]|nr:glycoside hydrolase family 127 protein [Streptosporangiaceae bacterium NEAU-GS5]
MDRRDFMKAAGGTTVGLVVAGGIISDPARAAARADIGVSVFPFPLSQVTLLDGPFRSNMLRTQAYLTFVDPDRLLHTFRLNAGLASSATPVGGWESPTTELRGHSMGHLLSALAQSYANTGSAAHKTKGDYLVAELAKCQRASGYLSAYPETFFDRLESGQSVWAPYYTIHKIMAGLLDQNLLAGNAQALTVLQNMAAWADTRTGRLTTAQMQAALNTEFGGMPEVLTNLYQATGNAAALTTAQRFDHATILNPLANGQDQLAGKHANTQIPKIIGAIREYHATGTVRYRDIARFFWDTVINHHSYVIGGNSNGEYFQTPDAIASQLSDTTCEVCNTYNMLKLARQLFFTDPSRVDYLDYYEKALFNQVLGQQDPQSSHGFVTYYTPLRAGGAKSYSNDYNNFTCDHGTGMESNTKYADSIYFFAGETLYVNLFIASQLSWRGMTIRQDTTFPEQASTRLTIISGGGHIALKIRIPSWTSGATVRVNGVSQSGVAAGLYPIDRTWAAGDVVDVTLPMALTLERTPDNPQVQAVKYGGIVLAGQYGSTGLSALPALNAASIAATSTPLQFTATANGSTVTLLPFYKTHHVNYTVYWSVSAPPPAFLAWYKFDETSGTTAADASGANHPATVAGGTSWVAGRTGNALNLAGSNGYARLPNGILGGVGDFTVACWVRLTAVSNWSRIFDFGTGTTANMFLVPRSGGGTVRFAITTSGAGGEQQVNGPAALATGAWAHVAVTLSGNTCILYVNKAEVARNTGVTLRPSGLGATTANYLGRSQYSGDPYLNGQLDDFRLYSRALSAAEIAAL